jgi:hypothetical protein
MDNNILNKAIGFLREKFSKEEIETINKYNLSLNEAITPPAPVQLTETKTDKGILSHEGELKEGTPVMIEGMPAPDGDYTLEDKTVLTVVAGSITAVKKAESEVKPEAPAEMAAQLSAHKKEVEKAFELKLASEKADLMKEIEELKNQNKIFFSFMDKVLKTPVDTTVVVPEKSWEDMTPLERYRYQKGN